MQRKSLFFFAFSNESSQRHTHTFRCEKLRRSQSYEYRCQSPVPCHSLLNLHRHRRVFQRCTIRVTHRKRHTLNALLIHAAHGVTSAAAHANHLDDILHQVLYRSKIQQLTHFCFKLISCCKDNKDSPDHQIFTSLAKTLFYLS